MFRAFANSFVSTWFDIFFYILFLTIEVCMFSEKVSVTLAGVALNAQQSNFSFKKAPDIDEEALFDNHTWLLEISRW